MTGFHQPREQIKLSLASEILRSSGRLEFAALGYSMLPTVWPGDVLTIESSSLEHAQPGQLVLYQRADRFFVHRVVRSQIIDGQMCLVTRGDSMPCEDAPVFPSEWLGVVTAVQRNGQRLSHVPRRTAVVRFLGWMLGSSDRLRSVALRLRARSNADSAVTPAEVLPG